MEVLEKYLEKVDESLRRERTNKRLKRMMELEDGVKRRRKMYAEGKLMFSCACGCGTLVECDIHEPAFWATKECGTKYLYNYHHANESMQISMRQDLQKFLTDILVRKVITVQFCIYLQNNFDALIAHQKKVIEGSAANYEAANSFLARSAKMAQGMFKGDDNEDF